MNEKNSVAKAMEKAAEKSDEATIVRSESDRVEAPRERAASFGGMQLQLSVVNSEIEGFKLCWINDDGGGLEKRYSQGWDFVTPDEAGADRKIRTLVVENKDVSDRISRYAGSQRDGSPMKAYLMKCPIELWDQIEAAKAAQADYWDESIYREERSIERGRSYVPKGYETVNKSAAFR